MLMRLRKELKRVLPKMLKAESASTGKNQNKHNNDFQNRRRKPEQF